MTARRIAYRMILCAGWLAALASLAAVLTGPQVLRVPAKDPPTNFPTPIDDQAESIPRLTPDEALRRLKLPAGFSATLFAAEPQVQQPIAATFDPRGRLWVAENYTYANSQKNFDLQLRDRIVILEDSDGDGTADRRTVFWDDIQRLTSIEIGFGGVYVLAPPNLLFVPDANGDDRPDGPPVVLLDGWDDSAARHNVVNGLKWGPDGWLYGRNGILATSWVGGPGTPQEQRTPINCGLWRFHPHRKTFEVVCHGTTNPWGSDWDDHGQLYFINTVIGHLWHVVPGAHYRRMYGDDLNPYAYELIEQTADHFHWDAANEPWTEQRKSVTPGTDRAGGGHAHSGLMIYLGDNWPGEYRGDMFTVNLHGQRLNRDRLERSGATYVGRHQPDFMASGDPWFRAIDLMYGPDGGVFVLDWSDIGECHENDGVHRSSGRIFKINYTAEPARDSRRTSPDLAKLTPIQLADLQLHANDWHVRQARRQLAERAARGDAVTAARDKLRTLLSDSADTTRRLRAVWALQALGALDVADLVQLLDDDDEHVRLWAVQLLVDPQPVPPTTVDALTRHAAQEKSGLVLTFLASALQRIPTADRLPLARHLAAHGEFATDRVFPAMVWYGVEPAVAANAHEAVELVRQSQLPKLNQFIARRTASQIEARPEGVAELVRFMATAPAKALAPLVTGMSEGLRGWQKAAAPSGWSEFATHRGSSLEPDLQQLVRELSVVFGDGRAVDDVKRIAADAKQPSASRRQAIRSLVASRVAGLSEALLPLLGDTTLADEAVRGLAAADLAGHAKLLLDNYRKMNRPARLAAVESLAQRRDTAGQLLSAVEAGVVARQEVSPFVLRQIQLLEDPSLQHQVTRLWPELRLIGGDKLAAIATYRKQLTDERLAGANLSQGRKLYDEACGKCHKLFGEGGTIGPDLTGAQRTNLNYWLENILDPSAVVAASFRMSLVELDDGRIINGVVGDTTDRTLTVQTPTEKLSLDRRTIVQIRPSSLSLMPDAQLATLSTDQVRDLVAYLMAPRQVPRTSAAAPATNK